MKYGNWTLGQTEALLNLLGGEEKAKAILRGEKILRIEALEIKLFDKNGRRIPPKGLQNAVCDPDKDFYLVQTEFRKAKDYANRLVRFQEAFHPGPVSAADFETKSKELIDELKANKLFANLLKGIYLPAVLPQIEAKNFDYGRTLEQTFLSAVESAYKKQFPNRSFCNYRKGELEGQVSIVSGARQEILVERMKRGIVYAIYFPNPLQGFSPLASREQMSELPESLILGGGFDTCVALMMYPDVLGRDWHTPGYDLSALQWRSLGCSLCFLAHDDELYFDRRATLGSAYDYYSSGFLFLGSA